MKFLRPLLALVLLAILIGAAWLWWALPSTVDMADYAPADSLVYVEFNNPAALAQAIQNSDVWQAAAPITQSKSISPNRLMTTAARAGNWSTRSRAFRTHSNRSRRRWNEYVRRGRHSESPS